MVNIFYSASLAISAISDMIVALFSFFFETTVAEVLSLEGFVSSLPPFWANIANGTLFNMLLGVGIILVLAGWVFKWFKEFVL